MLPKIPLKLALIVPFVLLTTCAVALVGYLSFRNGQGAAHDVAWQLQQEISGRIQSHVAAFLEPPQRINRLNAAAMQQGLLDSRNQRVLEQHFYRQVRIFETVTSIYFGNPQGGLADSGREGAGGGQYIIATDGFRSGSFRKYATDETGNRGELLVSVPDFDARQRSWYRRAVAQKSAVWSPAYLLYTGQDLAVCGCQPAGL